MCPGGFRYKAPYPEADAAGQQAAPARRRRAAEHAAAGPAARLRHGPEDLLVDADGTPHAHRQGLFLGGAARRARPDAHGDHQRGAGDPYPIDMLFMYMANMAGTRR